MRSSYIGITGFVSRDEVLAVSLAQPLNRSHLLMVGVLASVRTLAGLPESRYPERSPSIHKIQHIFTDDPRHLNLVHYHTNDTATLRGQLEQLFSLSGPHLHGLQLNLAWPDPAAIAWIKADAPPERQPRVVLQVGSQALKRIGRHPHKLVERLSQYRHQIDDVLIDPSGGQGLVFDPLEMWEYLHALREAHSSWLHLGIAGGLGPDSLERTEALTLEFPELSMDAESGLRTPEDDQLDIVRACRYLRLATKQVDGVRR